MSRCGDQIQHVPKTTLCQLTLCEASVLPDQTTLEPDDQLLLKRDKICPILPMTNNCPGEIQGLSLGELNRQFQLYVPQISIGATVGVTGPTGPTGATGDTVFGPPGITGPTGPPAPLCDIPGLTRVDRVSQTSYCFLQIPVFNPPVEFPLNDFPLDPETGKTLLYVPETEPLEYLPLEWNPNATPKTLLFQVEPNENPQYWNLQKQTTLQDGEQSVLFSGFLAEGPPLDNELYRIKGSIHPDSTIETVQFDLIFQISTEAFYDKILVEIFRNNSLSETFGPLSGSGSFTIPRVGLQKSTNDYFVVSYKKDNIESDPIDVIFFYLKNLISCQFSQISFDLLKSSRLG